MRVAESIILDAHIRGGYIKSFYHMSSRKAAGAERILVTGGRWNRFRRYNLAVENGVDTVNMGPPAAIKGSKSA